MIADPPEGYCDCGRRLRGHPPLPPVKPLRSWMAERSDTEDTIARRAAAEAARPNRVEPEVRKRRPKGEGLYSWDR